MSKSLRYNFFFLPFNIKKKIEKKIVYSLLYTLTIKTIDNTHYNHYS